MSRQRERRIHMSHYEIGLDDEFKYNEGIMDQDIKPGSNLRNETRSICNRWAYPEGATRPILVLAINEYVDTGRALVPGEIALIPFTLTNGIDLDNTLCTHVDPGKNLPEEYHEEANKNAKKYGLRKISTSFDGQASQDYRRIVSDFEVFIKANSEPVAIANPEDKDGGNEGPFIVFCKKEHVYRYAGGLNWLYNIAGKGDFPHKLVPLESVLVVLSHNGLKALAEENWYRRKDHHNLMRLFTKVVTKAVHAINSKVIPFPYSWNNRPTTLEHLQLLITDEISCNVTIHPELMDYVRVGSTMVRLAGRNFEEYPHPFFGVFMCEEQAASYLDLVAYGKKEALACAWHQDPSYVTDGPVIKRAIADNSPWYKKDKCARMSLARMIYLALDVIIVNFNFELEPVAGKHFPQ